MLPAGSVAVAVISASSGAANVSGPKAVLPLESVVTSAVPMNCWPSPWPEGSQISLAKNSSRKAVDGVEFSVPDTVTDPADATALVMTG